MAQPSPNARLLLELGFRQVSDPLRDPISYLNEFGDIERAIWGDERLLVRVACMRLVLEVGQRDAEQLYVRVNSNGITATGVYDHGTYWIRKQLTNMGPRGFRRLKSIGIPEEPSEAQ